MATHHVLDIETVPDVVRGLLAFIDQEPQLAPAASNVDRERFLLEESGSRWARRHRSGDVGLRDELHVRRPE